MQVHACFVDCHIQETKRQGFFLSYITNLDIKFVRYIFLGSVSPHKTNDIHLLNGWYIFVYGI